MAFLEWLDELSVAGGVGILVPAAVFAVSIAFFGFVIFNLHKAMSVQNTLGIDLSGLRRKGGALYWVLYGLSYVGLYGVVFPLLAYVWFSVLVVLLAFLYNTKEPDELLLIGMAVLTAVRVAAYYNEDLAKDIAKILPYGLLGIFLVNLGEFDYQQSIDLLGRTAVEEQTAFYYWVYISCQELVLRVTKPIIVTMYNFLKTRSGAQAKRVMKRRHREEAPTA